jgi:hypothetical protein
MGMQEFSSVPNILSIRDMKNSIEVCFEERRMKYLMRSYSVTALTFAFVFAASFAAKAQYGMSAGNSCPYQQDIGDDAVSIQDNIQEANADLKDLKSDLKDAKTDVKDFQRKLDRAKQDFERRGLSSDFAETVESHIENGAKCTDYQGHNIPGGAQVPPQQQKQSSADVPSRSRTPIVDSIPGKDSMGLAGDIAGPGASNNSKETSMITANRSPANAPVDGNDPSVTVQGDGPVGHGQFTDNEWNNVCDINKKGRVLDAVCGEQYSRMHVDKLFNLQVCKKSIKDMYDAKQKLDAAQAKQANLESAIEQRKEDIATMKRDMRDAIKDHNRELREEMTEGGCVDCMLKSSGYQVQQRNNSSSTGAIITNLGLGIASMYLGNQMQKTVAGYNARLGYPTQPIPAFGYGYPFIMAGVGAAISGGAGGGGYYGAVGSGGGSGAFGCASSGMSAGMSGPGGVMGYPNGMYGNPMAGGGMYMPGMGAWGGNGFNGMNGMFPGGLMGGGGYMAGYPMGGMAGISMMAGGGMPMGGGMGMGMPMMGGMPMGGGMGMGMPMMGGMPMGGGMALGMDPSMMQMQMQMQQQQMQLQMQMQQRAQENYMSRYQTVMGLQSELQGLMSRLQQAQMSLQYGGYTDISLGVGTGTTYYGGSTLGQPIYSTPGQQPIYTTPGTIGIPGTTGTGSQSVR